MNDDLYHALKTRIEGEVRFDSASRLLYSTDASIYEIEPIGVVIPRTHEDVFATILRKPAVEQRCKQALSEMANVVRHRRRLRRANAHPDAAVWGVEPRFWG